MTQKIAYEQPLNERIRTFLRIEQLMQRFDFFMRGEANWDSHCALITLLEIMDLAQRGDLKSEMMKELKRQAANMERLAEIPNIDSGRLRKILDRHNELIEELVDTGGQIGADLKSNDFLNSLRQRTAIPGGACDFDLPAYHYWLSRPAEERQRVMVEWIQPFGQVAEAAETALRLIRESAHAQTREAKNGFYQQNLEAQQPFQMIRILLPQESNCYPEISAGKHRFSVRFLLQTDLEARNAQIQDDVEFELACCAL